MNIEQRIEQLEIQCALLARKIEGLEYIGTLVAVCDLCRKNQANIDNHNAKAKKKAK